MLEGETVDIEMYDGTGGRYLTVTGHHIDVTPADVRESDAIEWVFDEYLAEDTDPGRGSGDATPGGESATTDLSDAELLEKAKNATNGEDFLRLWQGGVSGYPSHSEADLALCNKLAFWTGKDLTRIDRLFRQSGLYREKWGREDYRDRTLRKAIDDTSNVYEPAEGNSNTTDDPDTTTIEACDATLTQGDIVRVLGEDPQETGITDLSNGEIAWAFDEILHASTRHHLRLINEDKEPI